jgi:quercetin dioxygenase-like cupin family protein
VWRPFGYRTSRIIASTARTAERVQSGAFDLGGEDITVLASGARTNSSELFLQVGREGSGPPPHHHPWDEAFYVLRGEVTFGADGREATVGPGAFVRRW